MLKNVAIGGALIYLVMKWDIVREWLLSFLPMPLNYYVMTISPIHLGVLALVAWWLISRFAKTPKRQRFTFDSTQSQGDKLATWSFTCSAFRLDLNFIDGTASLSTHKGVGNEKKDGILKIGKGGRAFSRTVPLEGFRLIGIEDLKRLAYTTETYTGTVDGKPITMSKPGQSYETDTGKSQFTFGWDGSKQVDDKGYLKAIKDENNFWWIKPPPVPTEIKHAFNKHWQNAKMAISQYESESTGVMRKINEERRVAEKAAAKAEKERVVELARAELRKLIAEAKLTGDLGAFHYLGYDGKGALTWAIAVDRSGRALLKNGDDVWGGSLAGATAQVMQGSNSELLLEVQVVDEVYERTRLAKRRLQLLKGHEREVIMTWCDRINLLAQQLAVAKS